MRIQDGTLFALYSLYGPEHDASVNGSRLYTGVDRVHLVLWLCDGLLSCYGAGHLPC